MIDKEYLFLCRYLGLQPIVLASEQFVSLRKKTSRFSNLLKIFLFDNILIGNSHSELKEKLLIIIALHEVLDVGNSSFSREPSKLIVRLFEPLFHIIRIILKIFYRA